MQGPTFCISTVYVNTVHLQWIMGELLRKITWKGKTNAVRLGVKCSKGKSYRENTCMLIGSVEEGSPAYYNLPRSCTVYSRGPTLVLAGPIGHSEVERNNRSGFHKKKLFAGGGGAFTEL